VCASRLGEARRGTVIDKIVPVIIDVAMRQCRRVDNAIARSNDVVPGSRKIGQVGHANGCDVRSRRDRFRRATCRNDVELIACQARNKMPADEAAGSGDDDTPSPGQSCTKRSSARIACCLRTTLSEDRFTLFGIMRYRNL
jgi:hypothetical protein